ncbi:hypothetical protein AL705_06705 [Lawsonella clevelandensis]|uniref:Uncharacterized protein n=1 Tax=Lawsonella clevelandensis TaxID=1528099 RepID=A0A0M5L7W8_9ACTN|nr:hypothetical protein AL705_06705 [Lawsonella clevelandensis]
MPFFATKELIGVDMNAIGSSSKLWRVMSAPAARTVDASKVKVVTSGLWSVPQPQWEWGTLS